MNRHTTTVTHPAHDRLLQLKLKGANHLARVLDSDAPESTKLKAAMALARLAIPAPLASAASPPLPLPAGEGRGEGESAATPQHSAVDALLAVTQRTESQPSDPPAASSAAPATSDAPRPLAPTLSVPSAPKHTLLQRNLDLLPRHTRPHLPRIEARSA